MWRRLSRIRESRSTKRFREQPNWVLCEGVQANALELDAQLPPEGTHPPSTEQAQLISNACLALDNACRVIESYEDSRGRTTTQVDAAQMHLNSARTMWLRTLPPEDLIPHLPDLISIVKQHLPPDDTRRIAAEKAGWELQRASSVNQAAHDGAGRNHWWTVTRGADRSSSLSIPQLATVLDAVDAAREASLRERLRAANFARIVFMTALALACLAFVLAVAGAIWKSAAPLCFTPDNEIACPSRTESLAGGRSLDAVASRGDYAIVEIAGLTAACIAAATALRKVRGSTTNYGIPVALALLKLPTGALVAVLGIMLLRGQIVPGLSALDSSGQIIAWAVLFGYSQELFTNFVDKQGRQILEGVHGTADPKTPRETSASEAAATAAAAVTAPVSPPGTSGGDGRSSASTKSETTTS
ncbi:hypothetical protein GCM10010187_16360 [Actinomadura coerulea]|nr:hypothetical protein GCM10010187_16360 [Actinomadura coerulea]